MRTKLTIIGIAGGIGLAILAAVVVLAVWMGLAGLGIALAGAGLVLFVYKLAIQPWHSSWGATAEEVRMAMPGDEILGEDAPSTTRAITIAARPEDVWPWLVQIGYGRAGWYSYDWIDNDGRPSADRVVPELQELEVGDPIPMTPDMGPSVKALDPGRWIVAGDESTSWCLAIMPLPHDHTRLVSRWRSGWKLTPLSPFWLMIVDPGGFIMERRMLLGLKERIERAAPAIRLSAAA